MPRSHLGAASQSTREGFPPSPLWRYLLVLGQVFGIGKRSSQPGQKTRLGTLESLNLPVGECLVNTLTNHLKS